MKAARLYITDDDTRVAVNPKNALIEGKSRGKDFKTVDQLPKLLACMNGHGG